MKRTACFCASAGCLLLLIALFFSYRELRYICTPQSCIFSFDTRCSAQFQSEVSEFAHNLGNVQANDPLLFCEQLKKQFPLIGSIQTELSPAGTLFISIESAQPVGTINDDLVIAALGVRGSTASYDAACLEPLPHFLADSDNMESWPAQALCILAHIISRSLTEFYSIALGNYPELMLINKQQPKMTLHLRVDLLNADEIIQRGAAIYALLAERGAFTAKRQRRWVADMRFMKQIVLKVY